jgi:hypothetical protein
LSVSSRCAARYSARPLRTTLPPHAHVYALLVLVMLFWCGNTIVGRAIRLDVPPFTLAFLRWSLGIAIVLPLAWSKLRADWATIRASWPRLLLLGAIGIGRARRWRSVEDNGVPHAYSYGLTVTSRRLELP